MTRSVLVRQYISTLSKYNNYKYHKEFNKTINEMYLKLKPSEYYQVINLLNE